MTTKSNPEIRESVWMWTRPECERASAQPPLATEVIAVPQAGKHQERGRHPEGIDGQQRSALPGRLLGRSDGENRPEYRA